MSFNWKLTMGHLFPPFFHQLWKNIISWMSHHNAGNLTFIFSVFFNPILSKLDVWTHPTLPKHLLNHHLHWVSYSASICTWCPSITLEIVFFFIFNRDFYPHKRWHQEGSTNHAENWTIERCNRGSLACLWGRKQKKDLPSDSAWRPIWIKEPDLDD